ncbi:MAG: T9SS type A sorting domain-containing protein [Bacteroidota bacterium]
MRLTRVSHWSLLIAHCTITPCVIAQHTIPFASTGNAIELTIANSSSAPVSDVRIALINAPSWLVFASTEQILMQLNACEGLPALFSFSVEKAAPVNREHRLQFQISTSDGQNWTKEIAIVIAAPETFELFQNYPNPFNPTTTIAYQLPVPSRVTLRVFNLLGQEVATLVDGEQPVGFHQEVFEARGLASGVYVYQLVGKEASGRQFIARKAMTVLK